MEKEVIEILKDIKKELQAIRSCLESKKVSMDVNVNASRDVAFQSMSKEDIEAYRNISEKLYGCHVQGRVESKDIDVNQLADRLANRLNLSSGSSSRMCKKKAADQPMSPEDVKTYREIADQKQEESHIYVSERITNISELEKLMERERIALSALSTKLQGKALSENEIKGEIDKILQIQNQVSSFEFCVERRKTKGCIL